MSLNALRWLRLLGVVLLLGWAGCNWESPDPGPTPTPTPSPSPTATPTPTPIFNFNDAIELSRSSANEVKARRAEPLLRQIALAQANLQSELARVGVAASSSLRQALEPGSSAGVADAESSLSTAGALLEELIFLHGRIEATNFYRSDESGEPAAPNPQSALPALEVLSVGLPRLGQLGQLAGGPAVAWPDEREMLRRELEAAAGDLVAFWQGQEQLWRLGGAGNYREAIFLGSEFDAVGEMLRAQLMVGKLELTESSRVQFPGSAVVQGRIQSLRDTFDGVDGQEPGLAVFGPGLNEGLSLARPELVEPIGEAIEQMGAASDAESYAVVRAELQGLLEAATAAFGYSLQK